MIEPAVNGEAACPADAASASAVTALPTFNIFFISKALRPPPGGVCGGNADRLRGRLFLLLPPKLSERAENATPGPASEAGFNRHLTSPERALAPIACPTPARVYTSAPRRDPGSVTSQPVSTTEAPIPGRDGITT